MQCYVTQLPFHAQTWPWDQLLICRRTYFHNSWMTRFSDPRDWCECSDVNECVISAGHASMPWQGKVRFDGCWRRHNTEISSVPPERVVLSSWNSRKQRHAQLPLRRKKRYLELAVLFVLVLKHWPFLWEAWGGGGCSAFICECSKQEQSFPACRGFIWVMESS